MIEFLFFLILFVWEIFLSNFTSICHFDALKNIKVHVPPLNHIGLWVDDLPKAVNWMTLKGAYLSYAATLHKF